jgi:hypothetical protein
MTTVPVQINAAADTAFADADMLTARKAADGTLIKRSWLNVKALLKTYFDTLYSVVDHVHTFASLTSRPTTLVGYGITDAVAAVHSHPFADITSKPTTLVGYGITDSLQPANAALSSVAALGASLVSGNLLYATGANALVQLATGTNGHVLTLAAGVPSWAAPAGGGGWDMTGQVYATVTRVGGTSYQNTSGKPVFLYTTFSASMGSSRNAWLEVSSNNSTWLQVSQASSASSSIAGETVLAYVVLPPNYYYRYWGSSSGAHVTSVNARLLA